MMGLRDIAAFALGFSLFFLGSASPLALAANQTTLDVTAPSSVDVDEGFMLEVAYRNETDICGAICKVSGGWLLGYTYLDEISGCEYSIYIHGSDDSGDFTFTAECEKAGYETGTENFGVDVEKKNSDLTVLIEPDNPYPGDTVQVYAYYTTGSGGMIYGECEAELREQGGAKIDEIWLSTSGGLYKGSFSMPAETGSYKIEVTCSDDEYSTERESVSLETRKIEASLAVSYPKVFYYGQDVLIEADYTYMGTVPISGTCLVSLDGTEKQMGYTTAGYKGTVRVPYVAGQHSLKVSCSSDRYESMEKEVFITPSGRPAHITVVSPEGRTFYPTDTVQLKVSVTDDLTEEGVAGAQCVLDGWLPMAWKDGHYEVEVGGLGVGEVLLSIKCSKDFYSIGTGLLALEVAKIPLYVTFSDTREEYRSGEEMKVKAVVADIQGNPANVSCTARMDVYDLLFGGLLNSYTMEMSQEGDMQQTLTLKDPEKPARIMVTVTCSGDIYEEKSEWLEIRVRQLTRQIVEGATLFLCVTSAVLVALILLIRRKLKII